MTMIRVEVSYSTYGSHEIELPEGKTWDDVEDSWVKWDTLNIQFKGETEIRTYELGTGYDPEATDMKRPVSLEIFPLDAEGEPEYDSPLVSE